MVGKPEGKRLLRRSTHKWEENTGLDFREIRWEGVDSRHPDQNRDQWQALKNTVMNLSVP
jgi:hypothetical protein